MGICALLVCVGAACSPSDLPEATSSSEVRDAATTEEAAASAGTEAEADEAAQVYRAALEALSAALEDPASASSALEALFVDPALAASRDLVNTWAGFDQALRYPTGSVRSVDVLSVDISGDVATVTACVVDDGVVIDATTGDVVNDEVATVLEAARLHRIDRGWRLAERVQLERWEGAVPCDA